LSLKQAQKVHSNLHSNFYKNKFNSQNTKIFYDEGDCHHGVHAQHAVSHNAAALVHVEDRSYDENNQILLHAARSV